MTTQNVMKKIRVPDAGSPAVSAGAILRELNDTKAFVLLPAPVMALLESKQLSMPAFALYIYIFSRACLDKNYFAACRLSDLETFTQKAASTVRAYLAELESHELIERQYLTLGQKTLLTGIQLTFGQQDAQSMIRSTPNRKGKDWAAIEEKRMQTGQGRGVSLSAEEKNLFESPDNQQCPSPVFQRQKAFNENQDKTVYQKQNTKDLCQKNKNPDLDFAFTVFSLPEGNSALQKLEAMGYPGGAGHRLLAELAFSFQRGKWSSNRQKAINAMLKLVRENRWRSPY